MAGDRKWLGPGHLRPATDHRLSGVLWPCSGSDFSPAAAGNRCHGRAATASLASWALAGPAGPEGFACPVVTDRHAYGLDIDSTVNDAGSPAAHPWGEPSDGIVGIHAWTFSPEAGGVLVETEGSGAAPPSRLHPLEMQAAL